jgi:hypothetical protein
MVTNRGFDLARFALVASMVIGFAASPGLAKDESKAPARPMRVAILPVVNGSSEVGAAKIMEDVLRDRTKEVPVERAVFLQPTDTERLLRARNALDLADVVSDRWSKFGTIDSTAAAGLDSLLGVDAILLAKISEWENVRVNVIGAGESNTTVALQFALYDLKSLKKVWFKQPREQRFAQEVDASSGAVTYDQTGYIQSRKSTDPPRYEDVANDLVRGALKKFPNQ